MVDPDGVLVTGERLALLAKVATMYHSQGLRQPEIATRTHMSQSRVSRLLQEAVKLGIVRTVVVPPVGTFPDLEERVRAAYSLADVVVAEPRDPDDRGLLEALGRAGAEYLDATLTGGERVGISSWSSTLLATVDAMLPRTGRAVTEVVQVIGGVGDPTAQVQATRLTDRLARVTGAAPRYLPAPGVAPSALVRDALLADGAIAPLVDAWRHLSVVLAGIGTTTPSPLLRSSGNGVSDADAESLRALGAVGDVCLRFFDAEGRHVDGTVDDRVVGIDTETLAAVPRRIGIAGGPLKYEAIRGAVRGRWVDVLVTDRATAERLAADAPVVPDALVASGAPTASDPVAPEPVAPDPEPVSTPDSQGAS